MSLFFFLGRGDERKLDFFENKVLQTGLNELEVQKQKAKTKKQQGESGNSS